MGGGAREDGGGWKIKIWKIGRDSKTPLPQGLAVDRTRQPIMEKMVIDSGVALIKFWLEVSMEEQTKRFEARMHDPRKIWKLSPMDLESHRRWYDYSRARDEMLAATDTSFAPWYIVNADDKRRARLNCISHLLSLIPYHEIEREKVKLPARQKSHGYQEPKNRRYNLVPEVF